MAEPHVPHSRFWFSGLILAALVAAVGLPLALMNGADPQAPPAQEQPAPEPAPQASGPARVHLPWDMPLHERQSRLWPVVRSLSEREGMDPALVMAVVHVESRFDPQAVSERGARGLMQIDRRTARHLGLKNPLDPEANLKAGIRYLSDLHRLFQGDTTLALAAYNAGPRRVQEAGPAMPDIDQTKEFVEQVLEEAHHFRKRFRRMGG